MIISVSGVRGIVGKDLKRVLNVIHGIIENCFTHVIQDNLVAT